MIFCCRLFCVKPGQYIAQYFLSFFLFLSSGVKKFILFNVSGSRFNTYLGITGQNMFGSYKCYEFLRVALSLFFSSLNSKGSPMFMLKVIFTNFLPEIHLWKSVGLAVVTETK